MTTVSGTSSTSASASASSQLPLAQGTMKTILTSNTMLGTLENAISGSPSKTPTTQQVLSTLYALINPDNSKTITKANVQQAVTELGGSTASVNAIWSQLSPFGLNNISASSVQSSKFLISSVNANMLAVKQTYSTYTSSAAGIGESAASLLLTSNDLVSALSSESSTYVPPTSNQMISGLWALLDSKGTTAITESDVKTTVLAEGGTASQGEDLWKQLSPNGAANVGTTQFVQSAFVGAAVTANTQSVQSTVGKYQLSNTGTSNSILDKFSTGGADILNGAASGFSDSPIGSGGYTNNLNLFI